jgi:hypothetical protein
MKEEKDMKTESINFPIVQTEKGSVKKRRQFSLIAFLGGFGGMLFIFVGFIFLIVHSIIKDDAVFDEIGTTLIFLSYPLLFIAGHFMDKAAENKTKQLFL